MQTVYLIYILLSTDNNYVWIFFLFMFLTENYILKVWDTVDSKPESH